MSTPGTDGQADAGTFRPGWRALPLVVFLLVGVGYLLAGWRLPAGSLDDPGSGLYPRVVGSVFVLASIGMLVSHVRNGDGEAGKRSRSNIVRPAILLGVVLGYVVLVSVLGHILSSALVVGVVLKQTGQRSWWRVALIAVVIAAASYFLSSTLLGLPLPTGLLGLGF